MMKLGYANFVVELSPRAVFRPAARQYDQLLVAEAGQSGARRYDEIGTDPSEPAEHGSHSRVRADGHQSRWHPPAAAFVRSAYRRAITIFLRPGPAHLQPSDSRCLDCRKW